MWVKSGYWPVDPPKQCKTSQDIELADPHNLSVANITKQNFALY